MGERYERVFSLPGERYLEGAPVVIAAGALLKDRQTSGILAQLKFRNIRPAEIKALTAEVYPGDLSGRPLGGAVERLYLDLSVRRGEEFGQKQAIPLPDAATRTFSVRVTEVVFADLSTWKAPDAPWEPLPEKVLARTVIRHELMEQYLSEYGLRAEYLPWRTKDVRLCPCGVLNLAEEPVCYACGTKASPADFGVQTLQEHWDALRPEREEKARREARKKKRKRSVFAAVAALVVVATVLGILYYRASVGEFKRMQKELVGKTFAGECLVGKYDWDVDTITFSFVNDVTCDIDFSVKEADGNQRYRGSKQIEYSLTYEEGVFSLSWDWDIAPVGSFELTEDGGRYSFENSDWKGIGVQMTLIEEAG